MVTVYEFDGSARIHRLRSYYDKLAIEEQIAASLPGIKGWLLRKVTRVLLAQGRKGLETPTGPPPTGVG
ncbi:hypothetical protein [Rhodococcus sp. DMU1]|uniref:hypothetical protein n=1 Tax=Rhodococcus sp. DMU1 TaxID=2722825 RepID=UPI0002D21A46|nr:hypothetical protein [Rhodococcus sp. DMU1]QIX50837.1 hypothetical protein HFP48_15635 [Rhodococcus sp. DMU1]CCW11310.1 hypothetical protein EBESD8_18460 [Rhodococcus aetherivorans]